MTFEIPDSSSVNLHAVSEGVVCLSRHVPLGAVGRGPVVREADTTTLKLGGLKALFTDLARIGEDVVYGIDNIDSQRSNNDGDTGSNVAYLFD